MYALFVYNRRGTMSKNIYINRLDGGDVMTQIACLDGDQNASLGDGFKYSFSASKEAADNIIKSESYEELVGLAALERL